MTRHPRDRDDSDEQRIPGQPAQERETYPDGMERERKMPAGGNDKPRPSHPDDE